MRILRRPKLTLLMAALALVAIIALPLAVSAAPLHTQRAASTKTTHSFIDCSKGSPLCTEVYDSEKVFGEGKYIGHDEPSNLFYSNVPGSGNRMRYQLTLPKDPSPSLAGTPGVGYNFQLHPAFWFGMAMCDTQSFPEQLSTCTPNSDSNIVDPAVSPVKAGQAFMEMQFYPPGWVPFQLPGGISCDPTKWCAALNIDSLSQNAVTGQFLNDTCAARTGVEYVNFAFITKNGHPQPNSPPNPVNLTINTLTPNPSADLFMSSGDKLTVTLHDTSDGLRIDINDLTSGQDGSMTASAANGFGQVQFLPNPSTDCVNIPYDFHPMYSTSSELTRVTWTAHSYNIAFSDEIGHWDYCNGSNAIPLAGDCPTGNTEGLGANTEPSDPAVDDNVCWPSSSSLLVAVSGCYNPAGNSGFDGTSYIPDWPDGNTTLHPTSLLFTSPLTGSGYNVNYSRSAFEVDLPRVEDSAVCDRFTGVGCTLIPSTDDPAIGGSGFEPAQFYPFYSIRIVGGQCVWQLGNHIPGSKNDFGQNAQYGTLENVTYTAVGGGATTRYNDFRQVLSKNPCNA